MVTIKGSHLQPSSDDSSESAGSFSTTTERYLGNWLKNYAEYTSESEAPDTFHFWVALSVIASAVERNVYLNQGTYLLYPNMFVVLVAPPGKLGKSTTLRLGRNLLRRVDGINLGPDSVTREELIQQMAKLSKKHTKAAMTIHSSELSSLIEPSGVKMIQFLTDIYDGDFKWQHATKHSGRDTIKDPVLNLLAATTPSWIADGLPVNVVGHGFTSRVVFVYAEDPRYLRPFPKEPDPKLVNDLVNDLVHMSRLKGEFEWGDGTKEVYEKLYTEIHETTPHDYRVEGFHYRKRTHILKVAMCLSIAESDDLIIRPVDIKTAWDILRTTESTMARAFSAVGKYEQASDLERILAQIYETKGITETELYERNYAVGDIDQIGRIIAMLKKMGKVKVSHKDGATWILPA